MRKSHGVSAPPGVLLAALALIGGARPIGATPCCGNGLAGVGASA